jgi:hypothetical protein
MFEKSLDGGAPMSADGRPFRLEKGEPKDRRETGWRREMPQERRAGARPLR